TAQRVVGLHTSAVYRVYMYGFAPGFCYLGGVPKELVVSRRATPRPPHPPNTVLLGGGLTLVATFAMPTGWWIMGRTPERMFALERNPVFLVGAGVALRFGPGGSLAFESPRAGASRWAVFGACETAS